MLSRVNEAEESNPCMLGFGPVPGLCTFWTQGEHPCPSTRLGAVGRVPEGYFGQYVTIGIFVIAGAAIVFGTLLASRLLRPSVPRSDKYTT